MHVSKQGDLLVRRVLAVFALLLIAGTLWAQNIKVTGKVTDKNGEPVVGVGVIIKGTRTGISTSLDGNSEINAPGRAVLVFSSLGMKNPRKSPSTTGLLLISRWKMMHFY